MANLPPEAPFLAIGEPRRALDRLSLRKRLWAACDAAGLPRRGGLGWLRHEAATLLRERGDGLRDSTNGERPARREPWPLFSHPVGLRLTKSGPRAGA